MKINWRLTEFDVFITAAVFATLFCWLVVMLYSIPFGYSVTLHFNNYNEAIIEILLALFLLVNMFFVFLRITKQSLLNEEAVVL